MGCPLAGEGRPSGIPHMSLCTPVMLNASEASMRNAHPRQRIPGTPVLPFALNPAIGRAAYPAGPACSARLQGIPVTHVPPSPQRHRSRPATPIDSSQARNDKVGCAAPGALGMATSNPMRRAGPFRDRRGHLAGPDLVADVSALVHRHTNPCSSRQRVRS